MTRNVVRLGLLGLAVTLAAACGGDKKHGGSVVADSGLDGSPDPVGPGPGHAGGGAGGTANMDASTMAGGGSGGAGPNGGTGNMDGGMLDGSAPDGGPVIFTVPQAGGTATVLSGGQEVSFTFPASAAGLQITLTPAQGSDLGFADGDFDALIELQPSGTVFNPPVIVTSSDPTQSPLLFAGNTGPVAAEGMPFNATQGGFELSHFSWVGFSGYWCDTTQQWTSGTNANYCAQEATNTQNRHLDCIAKKFCITVQEDCCADPNGLITQGCGYSGFTNVNRVVTRSNDTNGGQYPYCDLSSLFDAGSDASADSGDGSTGGNLTCDQAFVAVNNDSGALSAAYRCQDTSSPAWMNGECEGGIPPGMSCNEFCSLVGMPCRGATFLDRGACNGGGSAFAGTCSENISDVYCSCGANLDGG